MQYLLIGYMFLFIDRPFEVYTWLGDMHVERLYMLFTLAAWTVHPKKRWLPNIQHAAYAAFAFAVVICWGMSPFAAHGQPVVEDWLKILVFYFLVVTTIHDEEGLQLIAVGFLAAMGLYMLHSFREYIGGRYKFRMGIPRMVGVDDTLGDPNSFGGSIVFALPLVVAVWKSGFGGRLGRLALFGYAGLSTLCILLTGSRSSFLGLVIWFMIIIWGTRYRFLALGAFAAGAPLAFLALPEELQTRFETIINPDVGPANAKESSEGRIHGLLNGIMLIQANPLNGIGPGAWRPATGSPIESHNLYGQLMGEMGLMGISTFSFLLLCYALNLRRIKRLKDQHPEWQNELMFTLPGAIGAAVFLLLFMGNFAHNLFRFSWLWYGGFLIICRYCAEQRAAAWVPEAEPESLEEAEMELPPGWVLHPPHG